MYRKDGALQLPLTSVVEIYKAGKVRTVMMLRESSDGEVRSNPPEVQTARKWKAEEETNKIITALEHRDVVGAVQDDRKGLGYNPFKPFCQMEPRERRDAVTDQVRKSERARREVHLIRCSQQGQVTNWEVNVVERRIGWNEIWRWRTSFLSFLIRATYDVLPSPVNLRRWSVTADPEEEKCRCGAKGTMKHILSNCSMALNRYTWRHNEVLKVFVDAAEKQVVAEAYGTQLQELKRNRITFVPQGTTPKKKAAPRPRARRTDGRQWRVDADLKGYERSFPIPTAKRPDLVLWCEEEREIHIVELTVPHEDNMAAAHERKEARYEELLDECREEGWKAMSFPIEVGCRGFVGHSVKRWLRIAGLGPRESSQLIRKVQETVERASHWVWLRRHDDDWLRGHDDSDEGRPCRDS